MVAHLLLQSFCLVHFYCITPPLNATCRRLCLQCTTNRSKLHHDGVATTTRAALVSHIVVQPHRSLEELRGGALANANRKDFNLYSVPLAAAAAAVARCGTVSYWLVIEVPRSLFWTNVTDHIDHFSFWFAAAAESDQGLPAPG